MMSIGEKNKVFGEKPERRHLEKPQSPQSLAWDLTGIRSDRLATNRLIGT